MFHTRYKLTFVLDSNPAPLLLQLCLRPGHVLPRAAHLLKRSPCSCGGKRPSVVRNLFVPVKLSLYSYNPS